MGTQLEGELLANPPVTECSAVLWFAMLAMHPSSPKLKIMRLIHGSFPAFLAALFLSATPHAAELPAERDMRGLRPMLEENIERPLRYWPDGNSFVITNGAERFNRPLYAANAPFRIDAGDLPEFSFYIPGRGGNLRFGILAGASSQWLDAAQHIVARYVPGSMRYEIRGAELALHLTVLPLADERGMIGRVDALNVPQAAELVFAFGGVNGMRGRRGGDIGCEVDPVAEFFRLRPEQCVGDRILLGDGVFVVHGSRGGSMAGIVPQFRLSTADAHRWFETPAALAGSAGGSGSTNVVLGRRSITNGETFYFLISQTVTNSRPPGAAGIDTEQLARVFSEAEEARRAVAERVAIETPDPFLNAAAAALNVAADGIWDERQRSFMHGAVAWRNRLLGWRGMYSGDALGWHERTRQHFEGFARQQNTNPVPDRIPDPEASANLSRNETALHSNGNMTRGHYDMNLVAVDAFFRHLLWTGDLEFAGRMWPVIERHLAWERRLFRREFGADKLPLYEAYAAIWASDDLGYNGGGSTHGSAYNYYHNAMAARVARMLGQDPSPYEQEAELIARGMRRELWLEDRGWFAEWKDLLGRQLVHPAAAAWSVYHVTDSHVTTPLEAWQMTRFVDTQFARIPLRGPNVPDGGVVMPLSSGWMPYTWSLNNVVVAENMHTALAYWQAGRVDGAFPLFKGAILDTMYLGLCPGNVGMCTWFDAYRRESQRDFADGVGSFSRALIEGLFGVQPDALAGELIVRPGFPPDWNRARIQHPDFTIAFEREGARDTYTVETRFPKPMALRLLTAAPRARVSSVSVNGRPANWRMIDDSVGTPRIEIAAEAAPTRSIVINWSGDPVASAPPEKLSAPGFEYASGAIPAATITEIADPQRALERASIEQNHVRGVVRGTPGHRTVFARAQQGDLRWWLPLAFEVRPPRELVQADAQEPSSLRFRIRDNTGAAVNGPVSVEAGGWTGQVTVRFGGGRETSDVGRRLARTLAPPTDETGRRLAGTLAPPGRESDIIEVPARGLLPGANRVVVRFADGSVVSNDIVNWRIQIPRDGVAGTEFEMIDLTDHFNDRVTQIFRNEYLGPRSPYCSLAVPKQGIGTWCHPTMTFDVDDSGLRLVSARQGGRIFVQGVPLATPSEPDAKNILFTSQWTNYPAEASVPLTGRASQAYLLMAGSTSAMQSRFDNGEVVITYADGGVERLALHNPTTWWPIDQDYFIDDFAFYRPEPIPPRVELKTGNIRVTTVNEFKGRGGTVPGGAATVLNIPLDPARELKSLTVRSLANEVVIGLMSVTLARPADPARADRMIPRERMQAIYDEIKTPFKYGIVLQPPPGKKIDCPNVFRHGNRWCMIYVQLENDPQGYTTQLAVSDDLLNWKPLGTILPRGPANSWDQANAGGGVALFDPRWGGSNGLLQYEGRYWLSYLGGDQFGYEKTPLSIGIAFTDDPSQPVPWQKLPRPVLRPDDPDARAFEKETLYKSYILRDDARSLGAQFVMFYNAKPSRGSEQIGMALSDDLSTWKRFGNGPVIENLPPPGARHGVISGDPQVVRMDDLWVMFYFGAFWKDGAFDTFAASRDLVHWTKWDGEDLIRPSEPWDTPFAHKPWLLKHDGVVYHFYCAVGGKEQHRAIALATSVDLKSRSNP